MSGNTEKVADKMGIHAPNSQIAIENLVVGSASDSGREQQDTATRVDWQDVCRAMLEDRRQLTSNRLLSFELQRDLLADNLFVDLALIQQKKADKRGNDVLPEQGSQLYEPAGYAEAERFEFSRFLVDVLSAPKNEKLTLIGEPGSGKTTLLQKIAFWLLDNSDDLAIWVSLAELRTKSLRDYLTEDWLKEAMMYADASIRADWEQQFSQRRVWLLLDGLDEMTAETRDALNLRGWVTQARVIITCRLNVWQANPRILQGFQTYRMLEFQLSQMEEFIQKWFRQDDATARKLQQALRQPGKERIRDLVRNPLRLTLLCATWHLRQGLPNSRAELYRQFVDDFYDWKRDRFPTTTQQQHQLNRKLGELARTAIDTELTRFRLRHRFVCDILGEANDTRSLLHLALQLGWINTVGVDPANPRQPVYAFFHATFQEYFAARTIDHWHFFLPAAHEDRPVPDPAHPDQTQPYRLFEPQWKEVMLLWLGREDIERETKTALLQKLQSFEDGCRSYYSSRAFFLAALGIAEFQDYEQAAEIVQQVICYSFGELDSEQEHWVTFFDPIERDARIALLGTARSLAIDALLTLLNEVEVEEIRYQIADLLGNIDFGNTKAIETLMALLNTVENDWLLWEIADSLIQIKPADKKAEKTLIELSKNAKDEWLKRDAAWSLLQIHLSHPDAIDTLIQILSNSQDVVLLWNLKLEGISIKSFRLLRTLLKTPYAGKTSGIRLASAAELFSIFARDTRILKTFFEVLKIRKSILNFLGLGDKASKKGIDCLHSITHSVDVIWVSSNRKLRRDKVWQLVKFFIDNPEIAKLVFELGVQYESEEAGKKPIYNLFKLLEIDIALVVTVWLDLVNSVKSEIIRAILARAIATAGFEDERITAKLVHLLNTTDEDREHIRRWIARGLMKIDPENPVMLSTFLELLKNSENWDTCRWVAASLGELCNENQAVVQVLLDLMTTTEERRISINVRRGLRKIVQPDALKIVVERLKDFLNQDTREENFLLYQNAYEVLWHCAARLPYGEFYRIWHGQAAGAGAAAKETGE